MMTASYANVANMAIWAANTGATNSGWAPIGSCNEDDGDRYSYRCGDSDDSAFVGEFHGNGNTIRNLYSRGPDAVGLFGLIGPGAEIRELNFAMPRLYGSGGDFDYVGALAGRNSGDVIGVGIMDGDFGGGGGEQDHVGALVGVNIEGKIIGCSVSTTATGNIMIRGGADEANRLGGLAGTNLRGLIASSYAHGTINILAGADNHDNVGGLAGWNYNGTIIASYAGANLNGGGGPSDNIGGLVGRNMGTIVATYARSSLTGEFGRITSLSGGLVGDTTSRVIASYAITNNEGTVVSSPRPGELRESLFLGYRAYEDGPTIPTDEVIASYGFGMVRNNNVAGPYYSTDATNTITAASQITAENSSTNAANRWDTAAWDFSAEHNPRVKWVTGYNDTTGVSACDATLLPAGATCGAVVPGQDFNR